MEIIKFEECGRDSITTFHRQCDLPCHVTDSLWVADHQNRRTWFVKLRQACLKSSPYCPARYRRIVAHPNGEFRLADANEDGRLCVGLRACGTVQLAQARTRMSFARQKDTENRLQRLSLVNIGLTESYNLEVCRAHL